MFINVPEVKLPRIVIIGCGFGGLELAKSLRHCEAQIVMIDKNNYHTFQPLLYQVATAGLEPDSIIYPIRKIFKGQANFHFRWGELQSVIPEKSLITTSIGELRYDHLIIATGSVTNFFGNKDFEAGSMPMKNVTDALNLRSLILQNFEMALLSYDKDELDALMTIMVVGGGPTGVELAGALCELKKHVLPTDYPELDFAKMRIILVENGKEVLATMHPDNRIRACKYLEEMGCEVWLNTGVAKYDGLKAETRDGKQLLTRNLIWSAGVSGQPPAGLKPELINRRGRVLTDEYCRVRGLENIYAIGDVASMESEKYPNGHPQVAPVAIQQAELWVKNYRAMLMGRPLTPFEYFDKGSMATIGRNKAVVELKYFTFGGMPGWLAWMGLHLMMLVGFRNKVIVFINWLWNYINYERNMRLIIRVFKRT